jgi:acetyl esterase/lipase
MGSIPVGGFLFGLTTLLAVVPVRRPRMLALTSWILSAGPNELPFLFAYIVIASNAGTLFEWRVGLDGTAISLAIAALTLLGLGIVARRAMRTGATIERALECALGTNWRSEIEPGSAARPRRHLPWLRILFLPWPFRPRPVERTRDIPYGDGGTEHLLDVYRHRAHPSRAPTLVYLHGGGFTRGRKSFEARPLLHHLASRGWTCISANYHLAASPAQGFPDHLIDAKRVIAWARTRGLEHGVDPGMIFMAGSSAGAHLTAMVATTSNDPAFQPGFEAADTTIVAGIGLYGYYGSLCDEQPVPTSPLAYADANARPMFVIHGDQDTYTPVEGARRAVDVLRASSRQPVVYAELPGAQHSFDVFHSIRFDTVVDAIEAFTAWMRARQESVSTA